MVTGARRALTQHDAAAAAGRSDLAPCSISRVTSADVDEQAANLKEWDQRYEQLTPGRFVGSLHEFCCGDIQVFRETTSQSVHESGGPSRGSRAFGIPVGTTTGVALFRGQPVDHESMVTLGGNDELDFYTPRGFEILGLVVDAAALERHAHAVEHRDIAADCGGLGAVKPEPTRLAALRSLVLSVLESADADPGPLQYRQTQRVLAQSLMGAAIAAVADDSALPKQPCPSRQHIVEAAKAYMHARITEPITIADLCVALGVSRRTLQYSFQEVLGLNPVCFLRAVRLNGVRRDLKRGEPPATSVQDAAAKWGFWHLGHFVTDYKRMFGELPSETLRRKRGRAFGARS